jgi:hypothetical protein
MIHRSFHMSIKSILRSIVRQADKDFDAGTLTEEKVEKYGIELYNRLEELHYEEMEEGYGDYDDLGFWDRREWNWDDFVGLSEVEDITDEFEKEYYEAVEELEEEAEEEERIQAEYAELTRKKRVIHIVKEGPKRARAKKPAAAKTKKRA